MIDLTSLLKESLRCYPFFLKRFFSESAMDYSKYSNGKYQKG